MLILTRRLMLERLRLFRNKNKNAGQASNAESNIEISSHNKEAEDLAESKIRTEQAQKDLDKH